MNLVPLFEEALEFQDYNGTVLSDGKVAVYYIGRTRLADIYEDVAAEYPAENPRVLNNLGMGPVYVNPAFDYEMVVFDTYGSELFSVKKYLASKGEHSTANVVVTPSESIAVSAWTVGDVQVYMPYLTGQLGKVYEGIDPIVVNNQVDKISANHVPLGVQDPLYFVQDDEEACIIGIDSSACGKTYSGISPILVDNTANTISITGDIGKDWTEEILSAANDASAAATAWTNSQGYLTGVDLSEYAKTDFVVSSIDAATSGKYDTSSFSVISASFLTALPPDVVYSADITGLATIAQLNEKLDKSDSANFYPMTANPSGYATEQWVENKGYLTGVDIPESANWNSTYNTVHDNSGNWTGGGVTGDFELVAGSGISIVDYPLEQKTVISVTAQGGNPEVEQAVIDNSATWDSVTSKADVTALSDYQTTAGMTAYQPAGDYYSASNPSGFVTSGELPDPITIGVQEGDTLDTDYDGLKIVKSTANGNEHINLHKKSTDQWLIHGNLVPTSPGSNKYLVTDDSGAMHWDNKSALAYDSAFEQSGGYITAYNGSAFKAGDEFPQSATDAINVVTGGSANWNGTTETVSSNSGVWGGSALPISAGPGIALNLVDGVLVISTAGE